MFINRHCSFKMRMLECPLLSYRASSDGGCCGRKVKFLPCEDSVVGETEADGSSNEGKVPHVLCSWHSISVCCSSTRTKISRETFSLCLFSLK